ncbi:helix-turn-helix transcriptional regulator [Rathayibacter sp. YIM 133350]|uniref:helix-turn-helix domain-containing protein n=1 Tax=Rathayibacter sp. YIM 133350 TaxID=3131992 RepID=UPI00307E75E8
MKQHAPDEPQKPTAPPAIEPLWRELLGDRLRRLRAERRGTLTETAERAGISPQYLSEIERGRKEPSSEMIAAVAGALDSSLVDLTQQVADELRRRELTASVHAALSRSMVALAA